jgi:hypothetical protein
VYGARFEPSTFDTYCRFSASSADNLILCKHLCAAPDTKIVDEGLRNDVYGSDGSGGFVNRFKSPLKLTDLRSVTIGATQSPPGTPLTLYYATTLDIDPGAISANSAYETVAPIAGLKATDAVMATPGGGLESGLIHSAGAIDGGVRLHIGNVTGASVPASKRTWTITVLR